jgi:flagellar biosynthesis chaperone FliJ
MNRIRRQAVQTQLNTLIDAKAAIEVLRDEEADYLDNMPESLQSGTKGEAAQAHIDQLEAAIEALDESIQALETIE